MALLFWMMMTKEMAAHQSSNLKAGTLYFDLEDLYDWIFLLRDFSQEKYFYWKVMLIFLRLLMFPIPLSLSTFAVFLS